MAAIKETVYFEKVLKAAFRALINKSESAVTLVVIKSPSSLIYLENLPLECFGLKSTVRRLAIAVVFLESTTSHGMGGGHCMGRGVFNPFLLLLIWWKIVP